MSIFNKIFKKKMDYQDIAESLASIIPPTVIKKSVIKPTKCKSCLSIYQANHSQIKSEKDVGYIFPKYNLFTQCPICKNYNAIEFEESEVTE